MSGELASTVLVTTKCSGGCQHCPFSNPDLEKLFLAPKLIKTIMTQTASRLTVLSGGEPFEHPQISEILTDLGKQTNSFRIATGGFVDLAPWVDKLKFLSRPAGPLRGISIGTDVLSSRVDHSKWIPIWKSNIRLFFESQIPYSLTFTTGSDLDFSRLDLWKWTGLFEGKPEFIYLRHAQDDLLDEWVRKLKDTFGDILIIHDEIESKKLCEWKT